LTRREGNKLTTEAENTIIDKAESPSSSAQSCKGEGMQGAAQTNQIRDKIATFEKILLEIEGHMTGDCFPLKHTFADGVYVREIFLPKDSIVVGKLHKHSHPNFLMSGEVTVVTEEGLKRIKAPCSMISPAGTKRIVLVHEDTVWITVHVTNETDLDKIECETIAKNYEELGLDEPTVEGITMEKLLEECSKEVA
jgi:hypothetical protein